MTITRTLIRCRERACPWPFDEEMHVPWCLAIEGTQHTREAQHQHHPKRSQGGRTIVAILCAFCHDRIDNRDWGNAVKEINGKRVYMIWDLHGEILYERELGEGRSDAARRVAAISVDDGDDGGSDNPDLPQTLGGASTGEGEDLSPSGGGLAGGSDALRDSLPSPAGAPGLGATYG